MAKKKNKKQREAALVEKWRNYFKKGDLEDWRRLCGDLGLADDLPSKTKCRAVEFPPSPILPLSPPPLSSPSQSSRSNLLTCSYFQPNSRP